ncbi:MAG: hypothetical protein HWN79_14205 [Candidatus Lokiarchaeota archaeon]|nr:hypothetical protein [Candidatus Lokiarchaeota archaeon]
MISFETERNPPWFFPYIENYSHIMLDMRFKTEDASVEMFNFSLDLEIQGFEGLLFYIYKPSLNTIEFDVIDHRTELIHTLMNLYINVKDYSSSDSLDFIIMPFGHFKEDHKFIPVLHSGKIEANYQAFTWTPSLLFKNIKSVIKIANKYDEIVPREYFDRYYYQFDSSFKGNKTEFLFSLINILVRLEDMPNMEPIVSKVKYLISKTNEMLFELCQRSIPLEMIDLLKEIERLKFNVGNLSKEEIYNWLDDLLNQYSDKI